jgi:hypothetical protein
MSVVDADHVPAASPNEVVIACTHPGQIGDALWAVPAMRELCRRRGCRADFWTSRACAAAADLIDAQEFVRHCVVDYGQRVEGGGGGIQPWHVPNAEGKDFGYASVYHFGIRSAITVPIPEYYCSMYGLPQLPNRYDLPSGYEGRALTEGPFVCLASRGENDYKQLFREFVRRCPVPVVEVGYPAQHVGTDLGSIDRTSHGFLEMAWVISKCRWFVGLMSAPLVIASGWDCLKIAPHSGIHWDMSHVIRTPLHHYPVVGWPVNPDPSVLLEYVK